MSSGLTSPPNARNWARWEIPNVPRLYVDLDGVCSDFTEHGAKVLGLSNNLEFADWLYGGHGPADQWAFVYRKCPTFWRDLPLMSSARDFWDRLREDTVNIWFLRAAVQAFEWPDIAEDKAAWVEANFQYPADRVIVVKKFTDKAAYARALECRHLLIDDTPANVAGFEQAGGHGFIYRPIAYPNAVTWATYWQKQANPIFSKTKF